MAIVTTPPAASSVVPDGAAELSAAPELPAAALSAAPEFWADDPADVLPDELVESSVLDVQAATNSITIPATANLPAVDLFIS